VTIYHIYLVTKPNIYITQIPMDTKTNLEIEPNQSSWWELLWKIFIWLLVWGILAILLFLILSIIWGIFTDSYTQVADYNSSSNPILPLLIILIGFLVSFIWNIWICGIYSLFFSKKYYRTRKSIWVIALTNWLLLLFLIPIYFIFGSDTNTMFMILGFHIIIGWFLSSLQSEIVSNPNYGASSVIWATLSFVLIMLIYSIIWKVAMDWWSQQKLYLLLLFPPVICYWLLPLGASIRESVYYKMYELWNNPFFIPSNDKSLDISEKWDVDDIDKDILNSPTKEVDDINIELE
jgi:hypothetical protein